jgi:hypothetical protein
MGDLEEQRSSLASSRVSNSMSCDMSALGDSSTQVFFLNFGSKPSDEGDDNDGDASSLASGKW